MKTIFNEKTTRLFITVLIFIFVFSVVLCFFDHTNFGGIPEERDKDLFNKWFNRFYLTSSSLSTVSYGDLYPLSNITRFIIILLQLSILINVVGILTS